MPTPIYMLRTYLGGEGGGDGCFMTENWYCDFMRFIYRVAG